MTLKSIIEEIVNLIDVIIPILGGIILLLVMLSLVRYIYKAGGAGNLGEERKTIAWGLLALFVVFSLWGILRVFKNIFIGIDY